MAVQNFEADTLENPHFKKGEILWELYIQGMMSYGLMADGNIYHRILSSLAVDQNLIKEDFCQIYK